MLPNCYFYASKHGQTCNPAISFLCTRVKEPDIDDYK
jgi:hypothetical protein